jgi:hypothetical protein
MYTQQMNNLDEFKKWITAVVESGSAEQLMHIWAQISYQLGISHLTRGAHVEIHQQEVSKLTLISHLFFPKICNC